jgi:ATP-dependent Lon protease
MDIDYEKAGNEAEPEGTSGEIVRAVDVLPAEIHLLPQGRRPFFPGQVMPLLVDSDPWEATIQAVQESQHHIIGLSLVKTDRVSDAGAQDFYTMGTACRIHRVQKDEGKLQVLVEGLQRFRIERWVSKHPPYTVRTSYYPETQYEHVSEVKAYAELVPLNPLYGEELKVFLEHFSPDDPSHLADFSASLTTAGKEELQEVLETTHILSRLEKVLRLINKELEVARAQMKIRKQVEEAIQGHQREFFLQQQMKAIQKELGLSKDDRTAEADKFRERLETLTVPEPVQGRIDEELEKLGLLETGSPEYAVTRNYLDWLTLLPWGKHTDDRLDLDAAREILDDDHEGLDDVKERILEFLGVGIMKGEVSGSIILFVGPPGVGKTSLGHSIANALGRKFFRFSLGGMRDEAEIKGHRRTYIGAMPGKFIQTIKTTGSANPVIMLDELDKVGASYHGDPASALLEVLDPEQNVDFLDHYLDVPFDLSKVLFICTANQLDTIPAPLLDRMEIISLSGYLAQEKLAIAKKHLLPRLLERAGLKKRGQLRIETSALRRIIDGYAREAGVRRLEKYLGKIVRKAVVKLLRGEPAPIKVRGGDVEDYLGKVIFKKEKRKSAVGVLTGLAWTAMGGVTLTVEANRIHSFSRGLKLTGQLGDVMRESAEIAYSYIMSNAGKFGVQPDYFKTSFIHLHVPAGATPKDGPSAGVTMATAILSLARGRRPVRRLAMTGELTLTGEVLPVGGIREKVIAAKRTGFKELILPEANRGDYEEIPDYVRDGMTVHFASTYADIVPLVFEK